MAGSAAPSQSPFDSARGAAAPVEGSKGRTLRLSAGGLAVLLLALLGACAPRPLALPAGPGVPLADPAAALEPAVASCRGVRTFTAELGLSGRAGRMRLRGRALAGLAAPGAARLEGLAPFGPPAFILVARERRATLLLPRDARVLEGADAEQILEALTGLPLGPDRLRAVLAGCVAVDPVAQAGRSFGGGWTAVDLQDGEVVYLRTVDRAPRIVAAELDGFIVEYADFLGSLPGRVRVRTPGAAADVAVDVTVTVAQLEVNTPIDPRAFEVVVPEDALPLTLEELRAAGPLGVRDH